MKQHITKEQVREYLRNEAIESSLLFRLWIWSILPCWIRGHRMTNLQYLIWSNGGSAICMKCKKEYET